LGKPLGELPVPLGIGSPCGNHGVHEVVGHATPLQRRSHLVSLGKIAPDNLQQGMLSPRPGVELSRLANQAANPVARIEQSRNEPAPDVASGAGDKHQVSFSRVL